MGSTNNLIKLFGNGGYYMKNKGDIIIYTLKSSKDNNIRYLGKTTEGDFKKRKISHIFEGNHPEIYNTHKSRWIRNILLNNYELIIEEIDRIIYTENWEWLEMFWISQLKCWGFNLLNMTSGGEGNKNQKFSKESIIKRNNKLKGKIRTKQQRLNVSKGLLGRKISEIHRINTRNSIIKLQGKPVSQFTIDGIFVKSYECVVDAAIALGNRNYNANIHKCCLRLSRYKTCKNFIWKYNKDIV